MQFGAKPLHWPPSGNFAVAAVGTSHHHSEIATITNNPTGASALVFCTASLRPEINNPYDRNAVAVIIDSKVVAHLPAILAPAFRSRLQEGEQQVTTCDAVITNGVVLDGNAYSYTIELDFELTDSSRPGTMAPTYPVIVRKSTAGLEFIEKGEGRFHLSVLLPEYSDRDLDNRHDVMNWTTDHWTTINYYLSNRKGIGLGFFAFAIPKERHRALFGDQMPFVGLLSKEQRIWTFLLTTNPTDEDIAECTKLFLLPEEVTSNEHWARVRSKPQVQVLYLDVDEAGQQYAAIQQTIARPSGKLIKTTLAVEGDLGQGDRVKQFGALVECADVIIAFYPNKMQLNIAKSTSLNCGLWPEKWRCGASIWFPTVRKTLVQTLDEAAARPSGMTLCKLVAETLQQHSGKTVKSRTYIGQII
jgi:hypothetical protein